MKLKHCVKTIDQIQEIKYVMTEKYIWRPLGTETKNLLFGSISKEVVKESW